MAKRRCLSRDVFESRKYLKLSVIAKCLYIALILHADDEGVVINPHIPANSLRCDEKGFEELVTEGFLLKIEDTYIIKHWYVHNKVQPSKMIPSLYQTELSRLKVNERKEYELL